MDVDTAYLILLNHATGATHGHPPLCGTSIGQDPGCKVCKLSTDIVIKLGGVRKLMKKLDDAVALDRAHRAIGWKA